METRSNLVLACALMVLGEIIAYAGIIVGAIFIPEIPGAAIMTFLPVNGLQAAIYFYFRWICSEWKNMGPTVNAAQPSQRYGGNIRGMNSNNAG